MVQRTELGAKNYCLGILFSLLSDIFQLNPPCEDGQTEAQSGQVPFPWSHSG